MVNHIKPKYYFSELPIGYSNWKLVFMTLYFSPIAADRILQGRQINIYYKREAFRGYRYDVTAAAVITKVDKTKVGKITGIKYAEIAKYKQRRWFPRQVENTKKMVAKGKEKFWIVAQKFSNSEWIYRMIDPEKYAKQTKKNIRNLDLQGFKIVKESPKFYKVDGNAFFFVGQRINYYPFRHQWYYPDGSDEIKGPVYKYKVVGHNNKGNPKVEFLTSADTTYAHRGNEIYTFKDLSNDEPYKEDVILYDGKRHYFKNNKFNESFDAYSYYLEHKDLDYKQLDHFYTDNYNFFA